MQHVTTFGLCPSSVLWDKLIHYNLCSLLLRPRQRLQSIVMSKFYVSVCLSVCVCVRVCVCVSQTGTSTLQR